MSPDVMSKPREASTPTIRENAPGWSKASTVQAMSPSGRSRTSSAAGLFRAEGGKETHVLAHLLVVEALEVARVEPRQVFLDQADVHTGKADGKLLGGRHGVRIPSFDKIRTSWTMGAWHETQ